ncbi:MAG: pyrimidine utilization transport protein G [Elusimicrobia bacterium CG08_land_8_20_14_0_20_59_10]|nr:MAG: pyrimidine utilization transport protein G [Elusimicrobia bacterium CG08_land_8_20_14_0_20_59_10]
MQKLYYPEDKLPLSRLVPMGMQHVVAMFGATVLAPILMGFNPQTAIFFSGIGTLVFIFITRGKVPSYLGSSFAFIGPVLAVTGGAAANIPYALCGIAGAAVLYGLAAAVTMKYGSKWIDRLMPPIVTGAVVALIGLNLSSSAVSNFLNADFRLASSADAIKLLVASVTFIVAASVSIYLRGFIRLLPILTGVVTGYILALLLGIIEPAQLNAIRNAPWVGLPPFITPTFSFNALLVIAPVFVVLVAENKGHIEAISGYMKRDLSPQLGRAYLGDAVASFISAMGGGTPQTTYAENMGVMAITRVFSVYNFIAAACIALLLGLCPKFGAVIQSIPAPVLGGVTIILYGLIAIMGIKIWLDAKVDFCSHKNLIIAGSSIIIATGLGVKGFTLGGVNIAGIAFGTVFAVVMNLALSFGGDEQEDERDPE